MASRTSIEFTIYGTPVPQPRPRISMRGGFPRAYTPADHPVVPYRKALVAAARKAYGKNGFGTLRRIRLEVWFVFSRPKSHYRKGGALASDAPRFPRPDADNLVKSVMDALTTAGLWGDDIQVCELRVRKRYVGPRIAPHTVVRVA